MNEENAIIPITPRKRYELGDGNTTIGDNLHFFTNIDNSLCDVFRDFAAAMNDLTAELIEVLKPLELIAQELNREKEAARLRSKNDIREKRRAMMKSRGYK